MSITHHEPDWVCAVPGVTYRWTLHLSNGDNVERSWTPETDIHIDTSEQWHWDSDPVYGPHPLQFAHHSHTVYKDDTYRDGVYCPTRPASGDASTMQGLIPPSGYTIILMVQYLEWVWFYAEDVALFHELYYALGSMSIQDQRALYKTLLTLEEPDRTQPGWDHKPSEPGYYLKEFLLSAQPR